MGGGKKMRVEKSRRDGKNRVAISPKLSFTSSVTPTRLEARAVQSKLSGVKAKWHY